MNKMYGFEGECVAKYNKRTYALFAESFALLPLATLIGGKFLVLHGGLFSSDDVSLDDIRKVNRKKQRQPGQSGLMMEMLWTDPQAEPGRGPSKRGVGMQFGPDVTKRFCEKNGLEAIIRSHEVRMEGYEVEHDGRCITGECGISSWGLLTIKSSRPRGTATAQRTRALTSTSVPITSSSSPSSRPSLTPTSPQW